MICLLKQTNKFIQNDRSYYNNCTYAGTFLITKKILNQKISFLDYSVDCLSK